MKRIIKEIRKREDVVIRIGRGDLGNYIYIEIRQFVRDKDGEYRATPKGLTFTPRLLDEIIEGFMEVKKTFQTDS